MRHARPWLALLAAGVVLAILFSRWVFGRDVGDALGAIVELLAGLLLLQLPAVGWRMAGGSRPQVLLLAIIIPLAVAEPWLGTSAARHQGMGGDLQGIEYTLMWLVVAPVVVSAVIVTLVAGRLIAIDRTADD